MAKKYQVNQWVRFVNSMMARMVRWNIAPKHTYLLTVPGRKSGKLYTTPVSLVEKDSGKWLVSPYGEVNWVNNARTSGEVIITSAGNNELFSIKELKPQESAPILKAYLNQEDFVRPYFEVQPDSPLEVFKAVAAKHPVFLLEAK
jgi:deazaflavin-dependent oxidoreductase (nitroreductase family)